MSCNFVRKFAATLANQPTISHLVKVITDIQIFASLIVSVVCFCKVFHYGIIQLRTDVWARLRMQCTISLLSVR